MREVTVTPVTQLVEYKGRVRARARSTCCAIQGQEALLAARLALRGLRGGGGREGLLVGRARDYPAGSWIVPGQAGLRAALESVAARFALDFDSAPAAPEVARHALDLPRLAVLQTWSDTQSAGWLRMQLDEQGLPYTLIMDEDVRRGGLRERFDLILFPDTGRCLKDMVGGIDPKFAPLAYTSTERSPSHGTPTSTADMTGGFTWAGIQNLETFVREGGVLVTLGGAATLPLDGGMARDVRRATVKNVGTCPAANCGPASGGRITRWPTATRRSPRSSAATAPSTRCAGPIAAASCCSGGRSRRRTTRTSRPRARGATRRRRRSWSAAASRAASELEGKPALLDLPVGQGRVIAFDFDPIHRLQTESDFRLVWNAILNWNDLRARRRRA